MASPCYYHPDTAASATCVQCGVPICSACTDRVGEKTVCQKCVKAVRDRLESQMAAAPPQAGGFGSPPPASGYGAGGSGAPQSQYGGQSYGGSAAVAAADQKQLTIGIILAAVIGIIGSLIWEKMWFNMGQRIPFLFIGIGVAVGYGFHKGVGRGGSTMALIATSVMGVTFLLAHLLLALDTTNALRAGSSPNATFSEGFSLAMSRLPIFNWISLAIGLGWCYRAVDNQQ